MAKKRKKDNEDSFYDYSGLYSDDTSEETEGERLDRRRKKKNRRITIGLIVVLVMSGIGKWSIEKNKADISISETDGTEDLHGNTGGTEDNDSSSNNGDIQTNNNIGNTSSIDNDSESAGNTYNNIDITETEESDTTEVIEEQNNGVELVYTNHGNEVDGTLDIISNVVYRLRNTRYIKIMRQDKSVSEVDTLNRIEKEYAGNKYSDFDYQYEYNFDIGKVKVYISDLGRKAWTSATQTAENNTYNMFNEVIFDYLGGGYEKGQVSVTKMNDTSINNIDCYVIKLLNKEDNNSTSVYLDKTLYRIQKIERDSVEQDNNISCTFEYRDDQSLIVEDSIKNITTDLGDLTIDEDEAAKEEKEKEKNYEESSKGNGGIGGTVGE